jgi:calcineurin-like phosphoesterase family protein
MTLLAPTSGHTYYSADQHFFHTNIIRHSRRPFESVEQMNRYIVDQHNEIVEEHDRVFLLGDLSLGRTEEALELVSEMNGVKYFVPGNHDRVFSKMAMKKDHTEWVSKYEAAGLTILPEIVNHTIGGHRVLLSHFPYDGDSHGRDRHAALRATDVGLPIIHGHVHDEFHIRGRQYNVGVDVNFFEPVREDIILAWLETAPTR